MHLSDKIKPDNHKLYFEAKKFKSLALIFEPTVQSSHVINFLYLFYKLSYEPATYNFKKQITFHLTAEVKKARIQKVQSNWQNIGGW